MEIAEKLIQELWLELQKPENSFKNIDEYKKLIQIVESDEEKIKDLVGPQNYDIIEDYKDSIDVLLDVSQYIAYRQGCQIIINYFSSLIEDGAAKQI